MTLNEKKRKNKKHCDSVTYTTGDPMLNLRFFNKINGTDFDDNEDVADKIASDLAGGETTNAGESAGVAGDTGSTGGEGGGIGESLTEAKREVRRYYIRPQNIFCANKAEIIKALIDIGDQNCSVYTLKYLGPEKDINKLTNKDIIYYYDNEILYDKNHVKVMDYDLYIKHEEERKKFNTDVEDVPEEKFNDEYEDRIHQNTVLEDFGDAEDFSYNKQTEEHYKLHGCYYVGTDKSDASSWLIGYTGTDWYVTLFKGKYYLTGNMVGDGYEEVNSESDIEFDSLDALEAELKRRGLASVRDRILDDNMPLDEDFDDIDMLGESKDKQFTCCICGETVDGYGNNPEPYKHTGRCCDNCNLKFVIPARLSQYRDEYSWPGLDDYFDEVDEE